VDLFAALCRHVVETAKATIKTQHSCRMSVVKLKFI